MDIIINTIRTRFKLSRQGWALRIRIPQPISREYRAGCVRLTPLASKRPLVSNRRCSKRRGKGNSMEAKRPATQLKMLFLQNMKSSAGKTFLYEKYWVARPRLDWMQGHSFLLNTPNHTAPHGPRRRNPIHYVDY